jgi:hypothetical protein
MPGSALVANMAVKMARMAATIQQLQQQNTELELKLASSLERVQAVIALELQVQALESTNIELCNKNTQLQRSLRDSTHSLWESWSEANDLEAQQDEHLKQVLHMQLPQLIQYIISNLSSSKMCDGICACC